MVQVCYVHTTLPNTQTPSINNKSPMSNSLSTSRTSAGLTACSKLGVYLNDLLSQGPEEHIQGESL